VSWSRWKMVGGLEVNLSLPVLYMSNELGFVLFFSCSFWLCVALSRLHFFFLVLVSSLFYASSRFFIPLDASDD